MNVKQWNRALFLLLAAALLVAGASTAFAKQEVRVFHAGSLSAPMAEIEAQFEKLNPDIDVLREAGGSAALARKIVDLGGECDAYFSADYAVIDRLLRPDYANWNVMFASNELVLMYGPESKFADEVNADNWFEIILKPDVRWGHSDPNADPCGYRALMVLQLAQEYYDRPDLFQEALDDPLRAVRPKAIDLVAMVESGAMDYAFEYRSVAVQHELDYVTLPPEVNLADPAMADLYATVGVERAGKEPGTTIVTKGAPIVYGCTVPIQAVNPDGGRAFVEYALSADGGLKVFEDMGQGIVGPRAAGAGEDNIPDCIKALLVK